MQRDAQNVTTNSLQDLYILENVEEISEGCLLVQELEILMDVKEASENYIQEVYMQKNFWKLKNIKRLAIVDCLNKICNLKKDICIYFSNFPKLIKLTYLVYRNFHLYTCSDVVALKMPMQIRNCKIRFSVWKSAILY